MKMSNFGFKEDAIPKEEMEKCVKCGRKTPYPVNMDVDLRENYVEGSG